MHQTVELKSDEHRILFAAAKAARLSLDVFLIYGGLRAARELLKGRDALRAHLMASERSGRAEAFSFDKMMASVEREYYAAKRRSRKRSSTTD